MEMRTEFFAVFDLLQKCFRNNACFQRTKADPLDPFDLFDLKDQFSQMIRCCLTGGRYSMFRLFFLCLFEITDIDSGEYDFPDPLTGQGLYFT